MASEVAESSRRRRSALTTQRRRWSRAAPRWDHHGSAGLGGVVDAVVAASTCETGTGEMGAGELGAVLDVGAGTGAVALRLAPGATRVVAVDVSEAMLGQLVERARDGGITNVYPVPAAVENLRLPAASFDLVVSNYALHHLLDRDKALFAKQALQWLRPGGRLVIGDMMIGRGGSARDREVLGAKVRLMLRRGPGGWWRIAKNAWRLMTRTCERPIPMDTWVQLLVAAGFVDVAAEPVVAEAALVTATRPRVDGAGDPVRGPATPGSRPTPVPAAPQPGS